MKPNARPGIRTGAYSYTQDLFANGVEQGLPFEMATQVSFFSESDQRQRAGGIYTVTFNIDTNGIDSATGFNHVNPVATVYFSCEGNTVKRRLSVVNGTSISGVADHVEVRVRDASIRGLVEPPIPKKYACTITIAPYTRADRGGVPCYLAVSTPIAVLGGTTQDVQVPADSGVTSSFIIASPGVGGTPIVQQIRGADGLVVATYDPRSDATTGFIPLFPGVTAIRLGNTGGGATVVNYAVMFGIDG